MPSVSSALVNVCQTVCPSTFFPVCSAGTGTGRVVIEAGIKCDQFQCLWDTVHRLPHGLRINDTVLHWGLTQEMTRREIKFALEVEEALNQIAEPEYREMVPRPPIPPR